MKQVYPVLLIFFWLIIGLYFGTGGITRLENDNLLKKSLNELDTVKVIYHEITFTNKAALISALEQEQTDNIYPWISNIPSFLAYILTACAFGLLGTIVRFFIEIVIEGKPIDGIKYLSAPVLGILTGIVILGISFLLPTLFFNVDADIRPTALMFLCLFSGIYLPQFYENLSAVFQKMFSKDK